MEFLDQLNLHENTRSQIEELLDLFQHGQFQGQADGGFDRGDLEMQIEAMLRADGIESPAPTATQVVDEVLGLEERGSPPAGGLEPPKVNVSQKLFDDPAGPDVPTQVDYDPEQILRHLGSGTQRGRESLEQQFFANNPFGGLSPRVEALQERNFGARSANFMLDALLDHGAATNEGSIFQGATGDQGGPTASQDPRYNYALWLRERANRGQAGFHAPDFDIRSRLADMGQRGIGETTDAQDLRKFVNKMSPTELHNMIFQSEMVGANPFLRDTISERVNRSIAAQDIGRSNFDILRDYAFASGGGGRGGAYSF